MSVLLLEWNAEQMWSLQPWNQYAIRDSTKSDQEPTQAC